MEPVLSTVDQEPLISVVIPAYNAGKFLNESLESMRNQTLSAIEIIVVDDGSNDDTADVARRHAAADLRVRVVSQQHRGVVAARNRGLALARAPWVALLDADDVSLPTRLERQLAYLREHPDVAALGTYGYRIGEHGRQLGVFDIGDADLDQYRRARAENEVIHLLASSVVMSRHLVQAVGGFRDYAGMVEDVDLWTRLADDNPVLALPERLVLYRVHGQSASTQRFYQQMTDTLLIAENTARRRSGRPELDPAAFQRMLESRPLLERLQRKAEWRSRYYYRVAGGLLADRKLRGVWWLALSFLFWPKVPLARLRSQILPWLRTRRLSR